MQRVQRDLICICVGLVVVFLIPISLWWKVGAILAIWLIVPTFPLWSLIFLEPLSTKVDEGDVLRVLRMDQWQTVPEIERSVAQYKKVSRVSRLDVLKHLWAIKDRGLCEGRERNPPQPALLSPVGYIWEYHRVIQ